MELTAACGVAALALFVAGFIWAGFNPVQRYLSPLRQFPGPAPLPFLGNLVSIATRDLTAYLSDCRTAYGGVFKIWFGNQPWVCVADPDLIRRVAYRVLSRPFSPTDAIHLLTGEQWEVDCSTLVFMKNGPTWRLARRAFESSIIHPQSLAGHLPAVWRCIRRYTSRLERYAATGEPLKLDTDLADLTLAVVGEAAYGVDFRTTGDSSEQGGCSSTEQQRQQQQQPAGGPCSSGSGSGSGSPGAELVAAVRECFDCLDVNKSTLYAPLKMIWPGLTPLWRWMAEHLPDAAQTRHMRARQKVADVSRQLMAQWQAAKQQQQQQQQGGGGGGGGAEGSGRAQSQAAGGGAEGAEGSVAAFVEVGGGISSSSFLASLLEGRRGAAQEDERLTDLQIVAQCLTFLLAGFETTAATISFTAFCLATHPEAQARLLEELDAHFAAAAAAGNSSHGQDAMPELPYLDAVLRESMRLLPAASALIRKSPEPLDLGGGRVVPGDTFVCLATHAVQHDPAIWPQPEAFRPERFLPDSGGRLGPLGGNSAHAWAPFGMGPRMCVGSKFATMVSKAVLLQIYRRFTFELHAKQVLPLRTRTALTHAPRDGIWVTVKARVGGCRLVLGHVLDGLVCNEEPLLCFKPASAEDVLHACAVAAKHGLKVSPRGSGHHYGGCSLVTGSLLLDLSALSGVQVDAEARTATVGPCVTGRALRAATAPWGLHFPGPHLSDVGLSGFILGGGNGWGVRHWGAAADNVLEFDAVVFGDTPAPEAAAVAAVAAAGTSGNSGSSSSSSSAGTPRLVRVTAESDPELFWGLKGAGSFLAVVTRFRLRLFPVPPQLPLTCAVYPLSALEQVGAFFQRFHASLPTCIEGSLAIVGGGGDDEGGSGSSSSSSSGSGAGGGSGSGSSSDGAGAAAAAAGGRRAAVTPVVIVSCTAFVEAGRPEVQAAYAQLRDFMPESRISIQEGPMPYDAALSILDPGWSWPGLCMYGHGCFVPVHELVAPPAAAAAAAGGGGCSGGGGGGGGGGALAALRQAADTMTSPRSILLVCPSAPSSAPGSGSSSSSSSCSTDGSSSSSSTTATGAAGSSSSSGCSCSGALGFRDTFYTAAYAMWTRTPQGPAADGDAAHAAWVRAAAAGLGPHVAGLYVNEVMHDQPGNSQVRASYEAAAYSRLQALKARADPGGLLRAL
ncbi:hypothetical protein HYH02_012301 [Chlamydomonas schloesseri]|uniref:FAD-binding PCMH-type domain-containing protein n=1 Tax=Chlamydomonas schloesseri TaxID=2026947 RepID=A0A835VYY7_9CHLO|nr:hypothetical protein HYH02_012301 [Chlamydomonas schloesseri]|eukprot:KAG2434472.1 hypothetical protein HYH02_012301 [Chlamydomonas schloesseri]